MLNLKELWKKYGNDAGDFDKVENKLSQRSDVHAIMFLDKLFPGTNDMFWCGADDQIFFKIRLDQFAQTATEEQFLELIRCGINLDWDCNCFSLFI